MASSCHIGLVEMTKTDIECGHTKITLHARGVDKSSKIIAFSHLNSTVFNDNFKYNFMREKLSQDWSY